MILIRKTTMKKIHVIRSIKRIVKHEVLEASEYIAIAFVLALPVLAKLCSTASSVESRICTPIASNLSDTVTVTVTITESE